jgi:hypothetical protein
MLSRFRSSAPQPGQCDLGVSSDSLRGSRWTATVMKLPIASPNGTATSTRISTSSTARPYGTHDTGATIGRKEVPYPAGTSRMYWTFCRNPVIVVSPGTNTGT